MNENKRNQKETPEARKEDRRMNCLVLIINVNSLLLLQQQLQRQRQMLWNVFHFGFHRKTKSVPFGDRAQKQRQRQQSIAKKAENCLRWRPTTTSTDGTALQ